MLADVEDDFGTIDGIASRLEMWKKYDVTAYTEAYAALCLPKVVGPIVRFNLLTWNPILVRPIISLRVIFFYLNG